MGTDDAEAARAAETAARLGRSSTALGRLAVADLSRLDWFLALPPEHRASVSLLVDDAVATFSRWLLSADLGPEQTLARTPSDFARVLSLEQTVELIQVVVSVSEGAITDLELAAPGQGDWLAGEIMRFSRDLAFEVARIYARLAERTATAGALLEAQILDAVVRGLDEPHLMSRAAALGWSGRALTVLVGDAPSGRPEAAVRAVARLARSRGYDALSGVHGASLVAVLGVPDRPGPGGPPPEPRPLEPLPAARAVLSAFGPGPVVAGPLVEGLDQAHRSARQALRAWRVAPMWPGVQRPATARELLPERALDGDPSALAELVELVHEPLVDSGLLDTVWAYLEAGGSAQLAATRLHLHHNTVRYRLAKVADLTGLAPADPRGAFVLRVALALGRRSAGAVGGSTKNCDPSL